MLLLNVLFCESQISCAKLLFFMVGGCVVNIYVFHE